MPTIAQLITIVILLVPGFLAIQVFSRLTPTKKLDAFDGSVLSVVFTLLIHGIYTTTYSYLHTDCILELIKHIKQQTWSSGMSRMIGFYTIGLLLFSIITGYFIAVLKSGGRIRTFITALGFENSRSENLWDEIIDLYKYKKTTPVIIMHFEEESYAGWIYRASFDLIKTDTKQIVIRKPLHKEKEGEWKELDVPFVFLDLKNVKAVYFLNGDEITDIK